MSDQPNPWQPWLALHGPPALLYARQLTPTSADAEDALQEGLTRFWKHKESARDTLALLYTCIRTAAYDLRRAALRRHRRESHRAQSTPLFAPATQDDLATAEIIQRALQKLPEDQREAVVLKIWAGLTFAEIAATTRAPLNTVTARYRYALEKLSHLLTPENSHD